MKTRHASLSYGKATIAYDVVCLPRKTLEIAVHPDRSVVVKVPLGTVASEVEKRVRRRAAWIERQRDYFRQFEPRTPHRHYVAGEMHLYLGRRYRLKIHRGEQDGVRLLGPYFEVQLSTVESPMHVRQLLEAWYATKATYWLASRFDCCWERFRNPRQAKPTLQIRKMQKRWGSLSSAGRLTLNTALIRAPRACIDYVITHELCHLQFHDHSPEFYGLLEKTMPDWKQRKAKLECTMV